MDEILVLDAGKVLDAPAGKVVERGTHVELLEKDGLYRKMWELQNRALIG
jgi:ABC-type transport system involved in Fe-S cluster assembly fused permease/ATPase subunit